jgi:hypothetical protein
MIQHHVSRWKSTDVSEKYSYRLHLAKCNFACNLLSHWFLAWFILLLAWSWKCSSETSADFQSYTWCYIPEDRSLYFSSVPLHMHGCGGSFWPMRSEMPWGLLLGKRITHAHILIANTNDAISSAQIWHGFVAVTFLETSSVLSPHLTQPLFGTSLCSCEHNFAHVNRKCLIPSLKWTHFSVGSKEDEFPEFSAEQNILGM